MFPLAVRCIAPEPLQQASSVATPVQGGRHVETAVRTIVCDTVQRSRYVGVPMQIYWLEVFDLLMLKNSAHEQLTLIGGSILRAVFLTAYQRWF